MDDFNMSTRLRNACDSCHKLKRKCTGVMPCDNCAQLGNVCQYSVAGRLGRPRGSKTRRNADNAAPRVQEPEVNNGQDNSEPSSSSNDFSGMAFLDLDAFDSGQYYDLPNDTSHGSQGMSNDFTMPGANASMNFEAFGTFDESTFAEPSAANMPETLDSNGHQPQVSINEQEESSRRCKRKYSPGRQDTASDIALTKDFHFGPRPQSQEGGSEDAAFALPCTCVTDLSSLLVVLKQASKPQRSLDSILCCVSDAIVRWNALVACECWQNTRDNTETLVLAIMSIRRVVTLLRDAGRAIESQASTDPANVCAGPKLHLGAYEVQGPERTVVLGILRKVSVRKLGAAIATMQNMLQTKQSHTDSEDAATLTVIKSILDDSADLNQ